MGIRADRKKRYAEKKSAVKQLMLKAMLEEFKRSGSLGKAATAADELIAQLYHATPQERNLYKEVIKELSAKLNREFEAAAREEKRDDTVIRGSEILGQQ